MTSKEAISFVAQNLNLNKKVGKCNLSNYEHRCNGLGHREMPGFSSTAPLYFKSRHKNYLRNEGARITRTA
jgi:hypothetical protein